MKDNVIIITGPTASGKSEIAKRIASSFNGELISADSQQIYKYMNIGTNKEVELIDINQYMIDIIDPDEEYSVEEFSNKVRLLIKEINKRGNVPVLVGGTGFYIDSVIFDMNYGKTSKDQTIRDKYERIAIDKGNHYLYKLLLDIDPITAQKYHENEKNRIIRALEIYESTGKPASTVREGEKRLNNEINPILFFLNYKERTNLYQKINNRVIKMIDKGLIEEFIDIKNKFNLNCNSRSMAAIGYKEIFPFIEDEIDIDLLIDTIQKNTRRYAKRQITRMKRYLDYNFTYEIIMDNINKNDAYDIIASILKDIYEF